MNDTNLAPILQILQGINKTLGQINTNLSLLLPNGAYVPFSQTDAAASTNTMYYSTTASKLVYKDSGGTVHALY